MNNINHFMKKKDISFNALSEKTGCAASYLCNIANGKKNNPSKRMMEKIAFALEETVPDIFYKNNNEEAI